MIRCIHGSRFPCQQCHGNAAGVTEERRASYYASMIDTLATAKFALMAPAPTPELGLLEVKAHAQTLLSKVAREISDYNVGDRPMSPPVRLLRLERHLQAAIAALAAASEVR